ncbi:nucleoside triphosphate pyrophosphatase [Actinomycetaceae bacterium MB13-C1-2]|nr:nucleoside triphosphate pyrophosphatase [Actinomycetaceae bacterium MB13-C1-2]
MTEPKERPRPRLILASKSPARRATLLAAGVDPIVRVSGVDEEAVVAELQSARDGEASPAEIVCAQAAAKALEVAGDFVGELNDANGNTAETCALSQVNGSTAAAGDICRMGNSPTEASNIYPPNPDAAEVSEIYLVIGCDSMLEIGGRMVGKPLTPEVARERIREMRGTDGTLWTGHSLVPIRAVNGEWVVDSPLTQAASTTVHFGQITDPEIDAYVATGEPLEVAGSFTIDALGGPFVEGVTGDPHAVVGISLPLLKKLTDKAGVFWPDFWTND